MGTGEECLEERLNRVERQNRWLSVALGGILLLVVVGATDQKDEIRAGSFKLVDGKGVARAEFAIKDDNPGLVFLDESGTDRIKIFHDQDGTGLYISDGDGTTRIGIAQFAHGGGGVALHGPESKGAVVLYFKDQGSLRFFDTEGNVTNKVMATPP